jgi:hypothetical protein
MSHFPVIVKLSAEKIASHGGSVESALEEALEPYREDTDDRRFVAFSDETDEAFKEYDTGSNHEGVPFKSSYPTFDAFCRKYHGYDLNAEGKYGYDHNPNAKWDWWAIGGRWLGFFKVKPGADRIIGRPGAFGNASNGGSDIINVGDLDRDAIAEATNAEASEFYDKYQLMLDGHEFDAFEGPREMAMRMGLVRVEKRTVEAGPGEVAFPWKNTVRPGDPRRDWTDIATRIGRQEFMTTYACCFNPNATWAALDEEGWHEPGKMGWFACDDSSPESYVAYKRSFMDKFINNAKPDDVLVCVDCHI